MAKLIEITCVNNKKKKKYPIGTSLKFVADDLGVKLNYPILGAMVNNGLEELSYEIFKPKTIKFIDYTHKDGVRMYVRSLYFVLMKAVNNLYKNAELRIDHSVSNGYFCEVLGKNLKMNLDMVSEIENEMKEIIEKDFPFLRKEMLNTEAVKIFEENNFTEKALLFKQNTRLYTSVYELDGATDYFYGYLVPSTSYLNNFELVPMYDGMLLRVPKRKYPNELRQIIIQNKMFDVVTEHKEWINILNAENVGRVNKQVLEGNGGELIKVAEALHEKKIAQIAENIKERGNVKLVLVSGPSSSGKTTFSKRLAVQLKVVGLKPLQISLDNYFVNREDTPLDENGEYNFETIDALDIDLFNKNINDLKQGKEVEMPEFDFGLGRKVYNGNFLKIDDDTIIIAEGIHALNPRLTEQIDDNIKYKVYVSALTQIGIDGHNRIPTTDTRLLRRTIRDYKYRNYSALDTFGRWDSVRRGEVVNIFPYQENADMMFNSTLIYEFGVLKKHAEPILKQINQLHEEYAEAQRLLKFLSYFKDIDEEEIPPTSILREFLGKSSFHY